MNMSNPDASSASISPDDWERIARYVTGEGSAAELDATQRWVDSDPHRVEVVRLVESILANVAGDDDKEIDVEGALSTVKTRMHEPQVLTFSARPLRPAHPVGAADQSRSHRAVGALLRVAAAVIIV